MQFANGLAGASTHYGSAKNRPLKRMQTSADILFSGILLANNGINVPNGHHMVGGHITCRSEDQVVRKNLRAAFALAVVGIMVAAVQPAWAANPATISVTVTIQNLSVSAAGPIAFGTVAAASQTVSGSASTVTNNGNSIETFSLSVTNPASWTAVQAAPAAEQYALLAQFNSTAPGSFSYANHALSTSSVASSGTKFAGDETGLSVAVSDTRSLWFRFDAPTTTAVASQQTITVTVTAAAG